MDKEAVGMERERRAFEAWAKDHVDSLALGRNGGYAYADASRAWKAWQARAALAQQPAAQAARLTDQQIDEIASRWFSAESDMDTIMGFARALLSRAAPSGEPVADISQLLVVLGKTGVQVSGGTHGYPWTVKLPSAQAEQAERVEGPGSGYDEPASFSVEQPAEEARGVDLPSDEQIAETSQQICRLLLGDVRKVDTDIIDSHIRALLAAPAEEAGGVLAAVLGPDEDGIPIARYSHRSHGMLEHPNGTWVRYADVAGRARRAAALLAAPATQTEKSNG